MVSQMHGTALAQWRLASRERRDPRRPSAIMGLEDEWEEGGIDLYAMAREEGAATQFRVLRQRYA
jgi:hypothetical protein